MWNELLWLNFSKVQITSPLFSTDRPFIRSPEELMQTKPFHFHKFSIICRCILWHFLYSSRTELCNTIRTCSGKFLFSHISLCDSHVHNTSSSNFDRLCPTRSTVGPVYRVFQSDHLCRRKKATHREIPNRVSQVWCNRLFLGCEV